jgi:uncharacterized protein YceH (UPF0502 family)
MAEPMTREQRQHFVHLRYCAGVTDALWSAESDAFVHASIIEFMERVRSLEAEVARLSAENAELRARWEEREWA